MAKSVVLLALLLPLVHADSLTTHTGSLTTHIGSLITHADSLAACSMHTFNNSGCTTAGNYASLPNVPTAAACCAACASNATGCFGWTFHAALKAKGRSCNLASNPRLQVGVQGATCGCRNTGCAAPAPPPPPPVPCVPVKRPPAPAPSMLPVGKRPHILTVLVDDLGWDDTAIHNDALTELTPTIAALKKEGVVLMRHHTCERPLLVLVVVVVVVVVVLLLLVVLVLPQLLTRGTRGAGTCGAPPRGAPSSPGASRCTSRASKRRQNPTICRCSSLF